ncbi:COX15/CtaA family protein [Vibrio wakamikoensis]|uniref:Heme A synthase n=1 Tax=Vibrio chaetopteri TaxID=3016528 RepID=A0AAU8BMX9_9VIBR
MGLINLVRASLVFTVIVIAMGAYTRLADAGLGCPDWPGCYGQLTVPSSKVAVVVANTLYPERAVEPYKAWLEMIHRYLAGGLGLMVFAITAIGLSKRRRELGIVLPISLSLVIVFQAALGMWTVTLKLMPIVVMGHLLGGFTMFSLLFFTYLKLRPKIEVRRANTTDEACNADMAFEPKVVDKPATQTLPTLVSSRLKILALVALFVTVLQIMLGGWTSSNYAAVVCTALPICEGNWAQYLDFKTAFTPVHFGFDDYEFGVLEYPARMTIHVTHRIGAIVVAFVVGLLAFRLWRYPHPAIRKVGVTLAVLLTLQLMLGLSNVVFHLPLPVAVLHNLGAAFLLLSLIHTNYVVHSARYVRIEKPTLTIVEANSQVTALKVSGDKESSL